MTFTNLDRIVSNFEVDIVTCIRDTRLRASQEIMECLENEIRQTALDLANDTRPDCTDRLVSSWTINYTPIGRDVLKESGDPEIEANTLSYDINDWSVPQILQFQFPPMDEALVPIQVYINNGVWYADAEAESYYPGYIDDILEENLSDIAEGDISWDHIGPTNRG